jgi:DNA-binding NarL/FixJ family response regulator
VGEDRNTNVNASGPIRVLLADDHTMFRQGLAGILASYGGMEVVAEVPNDAEALELARELSNQQIAASLYLAEATIKRHLANVYLKMGVSSRGEASREALLRDWITIEEVTQSDQGEGE